MIKRVKDALKYEKLMQKHLQDLILQMVEKIEDLESKVRDFEENEKNSIREEEENAPKITLL